MGGNANSEWSVAKPKRTQLAATNLLRKTGWNCSNLNKKNTNSDLRFKT